MKLQRLTFTDEFLDILDNMLGEKITKILLSLKNKPYFMDFNEIDVMLNTDSIRYTNAKGTKTKTRIGRGINKIFDACGVAKGSYSNADLERFVSLFKSFSNFDELTKNFEIVQGDDIKKWYHEKLYVNQGTLGNSCMKHSECQTFFKIYTENPKRIRMLILKDATGKKIIGRAIIWRNVYFRLEGQEMDERERVTIMDRIYSSEDYVIDLFKIYATKKGWIYKANQAMDADAYVKGGKVIKSPKICFYLQNYEFKEYPYMDSMIHFSPINGFISNKKFKDSTHLNATGGNAHIARIIQQAKVK